MVRGRPSRSTISRMLAPPVRFSRIDRTSIILSMTGMRCRLVISVVARGSSLAAARDVVYQAVAQIELRGSHYRTDIAAKAIDGLIEIPTAAAPQSLGVNK